MYWMYCATDAKDGNTEAGTVRNLFHKYLGISGYMFTHFILTVFRNLFNTNCSADHLNEDNGPHFMNLCITLN
jgi:hypothetical protein